MGSFGAHMASQVEDYKHIVATKDAEIARLRAVLDAGAETLAAREREIAQNHRDWKQLRAELDAAIEALGCGMGHGIDAGTSLAERIKSREAAHKAALAAASAALQAEREQADAIRAACPAIIRDGDGVTLWANTVNHHLLIKRIEDFDARRAAEKGTG